MHRPREPANGRVIVDGRDRGGGFALQPRVAVTAAHVIGDCEPSAIRYLPSLDSERIRVASVEADRELDVAVLSLEGDAPVQLVAGRAAEDARFHVDASPGPYDPRLTGVIRAVGWPVTLRSGRRVEVLQLGLDHPLGNYAGYSGCAVSSPAGSAVGVLVEQVPDRPSGPGASRIAPLLYAIPIETVLEAFRLEVRLQDVQPSAAAPGSAAALARAALRPPGVESHFVARDSELAAIARSWSDGEQAVLLHGLPGAGKSALAAEAAVRAEREFPDGVFYLDMRGLKDIVIGIETALDQVLDALELPPEPRPMAPEQKAALVRAEVRGRRVLIVLDDIRGEQQVRPLLLHSEGSSTLITSRSLLPALAGVTRLEVSAFGPADGVRLLERLAGPERVNADPAQSRRIVRLCGGLPLALRITGGRLATRPALSLREYADLLADERRRLGRLKLGDLDVRASFELSYRLLNEEDRRTLRHIGLLRPPTVGAGAVSAGAGREAGDSLERLVDAGLLAVEQDRYEVHELIRLYASDLLTQAERRDGLVRLGDFYISETERQVAALRTRAGAGPLRWATSERATLERLPADLAHEECFDLVIELALAVGPLYAPLYAWTTWEQTLRIGLEAARRTCDEDAATRLEHNLAVVLGKLGREDESKQLHEQVLNKSRAAGDARLEAHALAHLGQMAKQDGRPEEAVELLEASAAAYQRADDAHGFAQALGDWANALDDLGLHDEALRRHRDAGQRFAELGDRYSEGLELGNAGIALQRLDRLEDAADAHRASLAAFDAVGAEVPAAVATRRLAETLWELGDEAEGARLFANALATLEAASAPHELAEALAARETCLVHADRVDEALADARRAADLYAATNDMRAEALERIRIGHLRGELGDESALNDFVRAEELFRVASDLPSGPRAEGLSQQAIDALKQRDTAAALQLWTRAADMYGRMGLSWRAAPMLHLAAPMLEDAGDETGANALRERMAAHVEEAVESSLPPPWPVVTVHGAADRVQRALLHLWVVQGAEAAEWSGPYTIEVVSRGAWPPGWTMRFDATLMHVHPDLLSGRGLREHLRLGWHVYSMLAGHELMRRGVRSDDELGAFLLDLAGEWFAVRQFQEEPGTPMFRSAPAPVRAADVCPLGSAVGAALAGSAVHRNEAEAWITNHGDSTFARVAQESLASLADVTSASELLDALAGYYRRV